METVALLSMGPCINCRSRPNMIPRTILNGQPVSGIPSGPLNSEAYI